MVYRVYIIINVLANDLMDTSFMVRVGNWIDASGLGLLDDLAVSIE